MNINSLKKGQIIKNYKELCTILDWSVSSGGSKRSQFKELDMFCTYHKEGNKFIIDEIFEELKEKQDNRKNNKGKSADYIDDIELRLLGEFLTKGRDNNLTIGKSVLLRDVGLVNSNYSYCKQRQEKLANYLDIDKETIYDYYNSVDSMVVNNLEKALKNLVNEKIIDLDTTTIVCKNRLLNVDYKHETYIDEYDEEIERIIPIANSDMIYEEATLEEHDIILRVEGEVLDAMKVKRVTDLFATGRIKQYYNECYKQIRRELTDFNFYFKAYKITYNYDRIVNKLNEYGHDDWFKEIEQECNHIINCGVKDKILSNAENRKVRKDKEYEHAFGGIKPDEKHKCRLDKDYINKYNNINHNVIDIDAKNIKKKVLKTKQDKKLD
jgi:hypothetical protein